MWGVSFNLCQHVGWVLPLPSLWIMKLRHRDVTWHGKVSRSWAVNPNLHLLPFDCIACHSPYSTTPFPTEDPWTIWWTPTQQWLGGSVLSWKRLGTMFDKFLMPCAGQRASVYNHLVISKGSAGMAPSFSSLPSSSLHDQKIYDSSMKGKMKMWHKSGQITNA